MNPADIPAIHEIATQAMLAVFARAVASNVMADDEGVRRVDICIRAEGEGGDRGLSVEVEYFDAGGHLALGGFSL
jgi:hypothetical protein